MSILIRGMKMPDKCGHCRFADAFDCGVDGKFIPTHDTRRTDCPLCPVPPHGRLGDLDELEKTFREDADAEWNRFASPVNWADAFDDVANMIAETPTIIEADLAEEVKES